MYIIILIHPGRYNACYIPASRRQLNSNSMINMNSSISNLNPYNETKYGNDRLPKTSTLSNILRKISRETDEKRAVAAAATGGSVAAYLNTKTASNTIQQTSGLGPGGGDVVNGNTGILTREASKRWIPLYSNDNHVRASSPSSSSNIPLAQGLKTSSSDLTNSQLSSSNLPKISFTSFRKFRNKSFINNVE